MEWNLLLKSFFLDYVTKAPLHTHRKAKRQLKNLLDVKDSDMEQVSPCPTLMFSIVCGHYQLTEKGVEGGGHPGKPQRTQVQPFLCLLTG